MESGYRGWWRAHALTAGLLLAAFGIALLVRSLWMAPLIQQFGPLFLYGGGSDSFYHSRVMAYIIQNHANLGRDVLLNYPTGAVNPREPLFDWLNALLGMLFAPLFGGNAVTAGAWFLDAQGPLWAALGVFPVYLIGREVSSKRVGIVAAFLYPLMVANIDSSTFGYANYLSFYTFFILLTLFGFLKTVRATGHRRWVESYRHPSQIPGALRSFLRVERASVKWAVFTGVSFGALALAWQGYTFAVATIVLFLLFALIVERIRRIDSFGLYVNAWIVGLVGFPMAMPYFVPQGLFNGWFDLPLLLYFGTLLIALPFVLLRDTPWVVSVPVLLGIGGVAIGALDFVNHSFFVNIVTGQGYFVKTLVYSTVAEAQAPSIDALILGYGVITFFLAFVGLALVVYRMARQRFPRVLMLFLVFSIISIYLPISAAKFFYVGSAGYALLAAEPLVRLLDVASYPELRRTVGQLADRRGQFTAFRRAFKVRHVLVMALVVVIVLPNVWYSIDAGIPYNSKSQYNQQVYNTLPPFLRTSPQNAATFYLGAAGTQLDTPTQYDEAGYNWLAGQDQNLPAPQRPAFISWWDYGFQAVTQGQHPTVADNFQNGIDPAGNFLLAQNETLAIGILATELLAAEAKASGQPTLPSGLNALLAADGVDTVELHNLLVNQSHDIALVIAHPERYLPVDASHLDGANAMYDAVSYFLATSMSESALVTVYDDIQGYTGWSIRYAMVDSRLFPFSGQNTGIFYAPADLTDRVIGAGGAPTAYYTLSILGSDGTTYPVGNLPAGVTAVQYNINYLPAFYNSMIYKVFIGYNGTDIGSSPGIPGLSSSLQSDPIMPGWMMEHFQVVYRTAYYCPYSDPSTHPGCYYATNLPTAVALQKAYNGSANTAASSYFGGGETMLEYYPGQPMTGTVTLPDGTPVANARVTVFDSWGIPHMSTLTASNGAYSVILPPGNDTVNVTTGTFQGLTQQGGNALLSISVQVPNAVGLSASAPTLVRPVVLAPQRMQGFLYWNTANNSSFIPSADPTVAGATLTLWGGGSVRSVTTDASGSYAFNNLPPAVYNFSVTYRGANFSQPQVYAVPSGSGLTNRSIGLTAGEVRGTVRTSSGAPASGAEVLVSSAATGVAGVATANATGGYIVPNLGPGNYSVSASAPALGYASPPSAISVLTPGSKVTQNLTIAPVFTLSLAVVANGNPVAGFPVRFAPVPSMQPAGNGTAPPTGGPPTPGGGGTAQANSSVFFTDANGFVTATLPVGNYTVYGLGLVGTSLMAGFSTAYLPAPTRSVTLPPLFLSPAHALSGLITGGTVASVNSPTRLFVYDAHGDLLIASANVSSHYLLEVPTGSYSLVAIQGLTTASTPLTVAMSNVTVATDTTLDLTLGPGLRVQSRVGFPSSQTIGGLVPAEAAAVRVSVQPSGAFEATLSDANGTASFVVPASLPGGSSYCVAVSSIGYLPFSACGLTPTGLQTLLQIPLGLRSVGVNVTVSGLPSGSPLTLNFTGVSPTAQTKTVTGGPTFALNLTPGEYRITGWGVAPSSGLLVPPAPVNTTIPLGAVTTNISISVLREVGASGTMQLPLGLGVSAVTVTLTSPTLNVSVDGSSYTGRFLAAPGSYTAYASAPGANRSYATIVPVTVSTSGAVTPSLDLSAVATQLYANFTKPSGGYLAANFTAVITGPNGFALTVPVRSGQATAVLPMNLSLGFVASTTQLVPTSGGTGYAAFAVAPGYTCATDAAVVYCNVPLTSVPVLSALAGRLVYPGYPSAVPGTLRLVGPLPSGNVTTLAVAGGVFNVSLAPGTYSVYAATSVSGVVAANLTQVTVPATPGPPLALTLAPTWTDLVTILPPAGGTTGAATLTVRAANAMALSYNNVAFGSPFAVALPYGEYTVSASAPAAPYGVATNATASASVALVQGNAATTLTLAYKIIQTATIGVAAPTTVTIGNGGVATFALAVTNTGNAPESLHFLGTPGTWAFNFTPANVSLGTAFSNRTTSVEVTIVVPSGTPVAHPAIQIEAVLANGQPAGFASPLPVVALTPVYGIVAGGGLAGTVSPYSASVNFYVRNTGTVTEPVYLSVTDQARLEGLGWSLSILSGRNAVAGPVTIDAGGNQSYTVSLTAPSGHAIPPGTLSVLAAVANGTQPTSTATLTVPSVAVSLNSTAIVVTGPSVGSAPAYPDWLVPVLAFVPALALAAFLVARRLIKTRRWSRR